MEAYKSLQFQTALMCVKNLVRKFDSNDIGLQTEPTYLEDLIYAQEIEKARFRDDMRKLNLQVDEGNENIKKMEQ